MVELISVLVILGILSAVAIPRLNSATSYRTLQFRDQTVAALRFAQKTAVSHRRLVCIAFAATSVTLTIDHDKNGACNNVPLPLPGSNSNVVLSTDSSGVFASTPSALYFQPSGQGTDAAGQTINISTSIDGQTIHVAGATGYVGYAP